MKRLNQNRRVIRPTKPKKEKAQRLQPLGLISGITSNTPPLNEVVSYTNKLETATPEWKKQAFRDLLKEYQGNSCAIQRERFLAALKRFSVSTFEAMRYLDIYYPPARKHELSKRDGHEIVAVKSDAYTENGVLHRVAFYVLKPKA